MLCPPVLPLNLTHHSQSVNATPPHNPANPKIPKILILTMTPAR